MRWLRALLTGIVARVVGATTVLLALDGTGGQVVHPGYPTMWSMSTMARFPWVWTCVRAVAGDAGGLPLTAIRIVGTGPGATRVPVDDPILAIIRNPSVGVTEYQFRKQLWVDYLLTGNAYIWRPSPVELIRLHPAHVEPRAAGLGGPIVEFRVWDGTKWFSVFPSAMLHIKDVSWSDDVSSLLGESSIRCLHDDLTMELGAKTLAAQQASKGRPEILLSTEGQMGPDGAKELVGRWEEATKARHGAFATGRGVKATPLGWSPKEFEFAARSEVVRDVVLAVFEVPPARAGLASANFGTDKNQLRVYWDSIRRRTRAFDDAFSMLAQPGVRIEADFQDVEALQVSYTERLQRVAMWVGLGASPIDAARYEGFDDAPVGDTVADFHSPRPIDRQPEEPNPQSARAIQLALVGYLAEASPRYAHMAAAAEAGSDTTLLLRWESERCFAALERSVGITAGRWWAEEIAAATLEAVRMSDAVDEDQVRELSSVFGLERAARLAEQISRREAA